MDVTFFGGIIVLIAALYLVFWLFDKLRKEKPSRESRGTIDTLCSFRCGLVSGALMLGLGLLSVLLPGADLVYQGVALLIAGSVLILVSALGRCGSRRPAAPEE